jgi:hypothetical protein
MGARGGELTQSAYRSQGTYNQPERVYAMDVADHKLVVGTAGRHVFIYDVRNMAETMQRRESSLKYQTRAISCFPSGEGGPHAPTTHPHRRATTTAGRTHKCMPPDTHCWWLIGRVA